MAAWALEKQLRGHTSRVILCAWSLDGKRLASASDDRTVRVWEVGDWREVARLQGRAWPLADIACHVIGCYSTQDARVQSASDDVASYFGQALLQGHCCSANSTTARGVTCAWSPDGGRLAFTSSDTTVRVWAGACTRPLFGST
jgi:WD40 repeat protein